MVNNAAIAKIATKKRTAICSFFHKVEIVAILERGQDGEHCSKCELIYPIGAPWDAWRHQFKGGKNR